MIFFFCIGTSAHASQLATEAMYLHPGEVPDIETDVLTVNPAFGANIPSTMASFRADYSGRSSSFTDTVTSAQIETNQKVGSGDINYFLPIWNFGIFADAQGGQVEDSRSSQVSHSDRVRYGQVIAGGWVEFDKAFAIGGGYQQSGVRDEEAWLEESVTYKIIGGFLIRPANNHTFSYTAHFHNDASRYYLGPFVNPNYSGLALDFYRRLPAGLWSDKLIPVPPNSVISHLNYRYKHSGSTASIVNTNAFAVDGVYYATASYYLSWVLADWSLFVGTRGQKLKMKKSWTYANLKGDHVASAETMSIICGYRLQIYPWFRLSLASRLFRYETIDDTEYDYTLREFTEENSRSSYFVGWPTVGFQFMFTDSLNVEFFGQPVSYGETEYATVNSTSLSKNASISFKLNYGLK